MKASIVLPEHYGRVWPLIKEYMDGAAKYTYGRFTTEDILVGLIRGGQELWIAYEDEKIYGAVVTEFMQYPQMKTLVMHFTGGIELPRWKNEMLELLQRFAQDNECKIIESYGRPGWAKVFEDDGYKSRFTFYELPVETRT